MATVTFNETTNMASLPTSFSVIDGSSGGGEIDILNTDISVGAYIIGSFILGLGFSSGTITRTMVDSLESGLFS